MHELSLVEGIIDAVQDTARERNGKVRSFNVLVGELAQFDVRLIRELLAELKKGTQLDGAKVVVKLEKSKFRCLGCNSEWGFDDLVGQLKGSEKEMVHFLPELLSSYSKCPTCSKSYFEIERGRSVRIAGVVLDVQS